MSGDGPERCEDGGDDLSHVSHEWCEDPAVLESVWAKTCCSFVDRTHHGAGAPSVERMGERHVWRAELHALSLEVDTAEERGFHEKGVDRRTYVVEVARKRELLRSASATRGVGSLVDVDDKTCPGQGQRCSQTVRARSDDDGVQGPHRCSP